MGPRIGPLTESPPTYGSTLNTPTMGMGLEAPGGMTPATPPVLSSPMTPPALNTGAGLGAPPSPAATSPLNQLATGSGAMAETRRQAYGTPAQREAAASLMR